MIITTKTIIMITGTINVAINIATIVSLLLMLPTLFCGSAFQSVSKFYRKGIRARAIL